MHNRRPQILVTNDDGVDGIGMHALADAMVELGEVTVVAPDEEYSGYSSAIGPIWDEHPHVHKAHIDGIDRVWAVSGPPALCVMYTCLGAFDFRPDIIVSGINPGANVGRSVYYSGTIGATLTGRNYGIPGVAISQAVDGASAEGQAWDDVVASIDWNVSATVARRVVASLLASLDETYEPGTAPVLNVNVPATSLDGIKGWKWGEVGHFPRRSLTAVTLRPHPGHKDSYQVNFEFGEENSLSPEIDTAIVSENRVSLSYLSEISAIDHRHARMGKAVASALDDLIG
ncbi:MAG: 5'/3'-nucleotidase SurE [Acidimicrobiia bacterium]|nr:5'/3'-nucleotidase SurE [Acidimicrobiia bacterium]